MNRAAAVFRSRYRLGEFVFQLALALILLAIAAIMILPMLYVIAVSFTHAEAYVPNRLILWPKKWSIDAYRFVLAGPGFLNAFRASLFLTVVGTPLKLLVVASFAYALSKQDLPGRTPMLSMVLFTMLFGAGLIPNYLLIKNLGLINSWWALILPSFPDAWSLMVLKSFFQSLPPELEDAAQIDGSSELGIFFRIILPLSKAPLAAFGLFFAVGFWNTYFSAILYLNDAEKWPLQVMLQQVVMLSQIESFLDPGLVADLKLMKVIPPETVKMATVTIVIAPILMVYPFLQKYFAKGVLLGSVKG